MTTLSVVRIRRFLPILAAAMLAGTSAAAETPAPGSTGSKLLEGLDTHHFPITTDSEEAQAWFNQGLVLLYGFNHGAAIRSFTEAAARDPEAAMPWWGIAHANGMHLNATEVMEDQWRAGHEAAQKALSLLDDETPLERALLEAVAERTAWPMPAEQRPYDEAFAEAMKAVYEAHPNHPDVAALYAESLMNLQPWDYWTDDLEPKGYTAEILSVIERGLATAPYHAQLCHLYIHATEAGPNPGAAEAAADRLLTAVPAAGHLVHMPSHTYARVGRYTDAVISNEMAVEADEAFFALGTDPGMYYVYHAHNLHFLAFASMMEGRYETALEAARQLETAVPEPALDAFAFLIEGIMPTTLHVHKRFGHWDAILDEPAPPEKRPVMLATHYYARGIALAALGRTDEAREEQARFEAQIARVPADWWVMANKMHDVLPVGRHMLEGEIAYREGDLDAAWEALEMAIELEDQLAYDEPPGWMIPVRHAMGALLLESGDAERAETLYREDQEKHPGNGWSLLGLQQALEAQGKTDEAAEYAEKLDKAWKRVDDRPTSSCLCAPEPLAAR